MRRAVLMVACVVAGTAIAVAVTATGSAGPAPAGPVSMTLTTSHDDGVQLRPGPHGVWGFWGDFTSPDPVDEGGYRATCVALGPSGPPSPVPTYAGTARAAATTPDDRLTCDVVLAFGGDNSAGGTLVVQGLIKKPAGSALFAGPPPTSVRLLAITGGAGMNYEAKQGKAKPSGENHLVLNFK